MISSEHAGSQLPKKPQITQWESVTLVPAKVEINDDIVLTRKGLTAISSYHIEPARKLQGYVADGGKVILGQSKRVQ